MSYQNGDSFVGTVVSHKLRTLGGHVVVSMRVAAPDEQEYEATIFLTEKSASMAKAQLSACGFDSDKQDLTELDDRRELLAGHSVQVDVEEYNNRLQFRIHIHDKPTKDALKKLQDVMRAPKRGKNDDEDFPF